MKKFIQKEQPKEKICIVVEIEPDDEKLAEIIIVNNNKKKIDHLCKAYKNELWVFLTNQDEEVTLNELIKRKTQILRRKLATKKQVLIDTISILINRKSPKHESDNTQYPKCSRWLHFGSLRNVVGHIFQ